MTSSSAILWLALALASALFFGALARHDSRSQARHDQTFGLSVENHPTGCWEVKNVTFDSKAAACHFRRRDLVCSVGGKAADSISSSDIAAWSQQTDCGTLAVKKHSYVDDHVIFVTIASYVVLSAWSSTASVLIHVTNILCFLLQVTAFAAAPSLFMTRKALDRST
jgi:hypothetical protein